MTEEGATTPRSWRFDRWPRQRWKKIGVLLIVLLLADWMQPAGRQLSTRAGLLGIDLYQATLSRLMPSFGVRCRFEPTCSHYGEGALRCSGLPRGGWLAAWRILRCGPWTPQGTHDPPPCEEGEPNSRNLRPAQDPPGIPR